MSVDTPALTIAELSAGDVSLGSAAAEAWYKITSEAASVDVPDFPPPCRYRQAVALQVPYPGQIDRHWLAYLGADPVGAASLSLPVLDNLENSDLNVVVHPDHRRRGVGRALYQHAVAAAREAGRKRTAGMCVSTLPGGPERDGAGAAFATAMGMSNALVEVRRRLDLSTVDEAGHDRLLAEAWSHAPGHSLVTWRNTIPDEYIDDVAILDGRLIADSPMGDLAWEPEKVDAARLRAVEAVRERYRGRSYQAAVRHDASGRVVAWTALILFPSVPSHAWQGITLVDPAHRGKRLGTIVKIANLRHATAHEPELRTVDTWNAAVNEHMIAINEAVGFRAVDSWINWQTDI